MTSAVGILNGNWRDGLYLAHFNGPDWFELEREAMQRGIDAMGFQTFDDWYSSDAVPAFGPAKERIDMIDAKIAMMAVVELPDNFEAPASADPDEADRQDTIGYCRNGF